MVDALCDDHRPLGNPMLPDSRPSRRRAGPDPRPILDPRVIRLPFPAYREKLSYVSGNRDHHLSRSRGHAGNAQAMAAHESPRTTKLYDRLAMRSRSMRSSELLFEDGQRRLTGACHAFRIWQQETCVHQAPASPDTPSEFAPFPVNLTMPDHILHPEVGN